MLALVGSLPYQSAEQAMAYTLRLRRFGGIPTFPELPLLGDSMTNRIKSPEELSCLILFKQIVFSIVKIQSIGPVSLRQSEEYRELSEDKIVEIIIEYIKVLRKGLITEKEVLFLDEPGMKESLPGFEYAWEAIFSVFQSTIKGVHVCGKSIPLPDILKIKWLDILSFDASVVDITIFPEYQIFRENGGIVAWGVEKESDVKDWQIGDIITPRCGIAPPVHSTLDCEKVFNLLNFVYQKMNYPHG